MNNLRAITSICLLAYCNFGAMVEDNWQLFQSANGKFSIEMPKGNIKESVDYRETEIGMITVFNYIHQPEKPNEADNILYMVTYYDFPTGTMHQDSMALLEAFFEETTQTAAKSIGGKVLYVSPLGEQSATGRQWRIDYLNDRVSIRTKAILKKNRYYAVQVITMSEKGVNPSLDRFVNSFKILNSN